MNYSHQNKIITAETLAKEKPHLKVIDVSDWSYGKWLAFRSKGIGCSEVGTVLDHNEYLEPAIFFNQKTGRVNYGTVDNNAMFMGRFMEPHVGDLWRYYDISNGDWQSTAKNIENKTPLREFYKPAVYVINPKYPWLFASPDGLFWMKSYIKGLEIKTILSMAAKKYLEGIPTSYIFQCNALMMALDTDYWELAMLQDGRDFSVYPIERNDAIVNMIEENCSEFWDKVIRGREIRADINMFGVDSDEAQELELLYRDLEPEVLVKEERRFNEFLNERFKADPNKEILPNEEITSLVNERQQLKTNQKFSKESITQIDAKIKYFMGDHCKMETDSYRVSYNPDKNGRRSLRINELKESS